MDTREDNSKWHLIRNDNGEWISDEYAEYLSTIDATILKGRYGNKISIQHGPDGSLWCYKQQLKELRQENMIEKPKIRKLKINRAR